MVKLFPSVKKESADGPMELPSRPSFTKRSVALLCLFIVFTVLVRLFALDSDAYPRLSWSSALLTDEGFYIHNARNLVLFGHAQTDDFNNALIMPTLHLVQVAVFFLFGVGAIQARLISVVISLLTLLVFYAALRRAFGAKTAWIGTLFLSLDHINFLYNRMALMDTPATLPMVCAFYAFVRAAAPKKTNNDEVETPKGVFSPGWAAVCGFFLGISYATRGVSAYLLPVPPVLFWWVARRYGQPGGFRALMLGLFGTLLLYGLVWYLPNRAELSRINHYYMMEQLLPHSLNHLRQNIAHALLGDERGLAPYLFRHSPVQCVLALCWLLSWRLQLRSERLDKAFLGLWVVLGWVVIAVISYSPSRYYVLFYPAMAGLAALAVVNWRETWFTVLESRWARAALSGLLVYHLAEAFLHHENDPLLYGLSIAAVAVPFVLPRTVRFPDFRKSRWTEAAILGLWAAVNLGWTSDWLLHMTYGQRDADRWLAAHLPADSVLIGAVAPGLCLNNRFRVVSVIEKLCNDKKPVERFAPAPRFVLILDGKKWKERWWAQNYPALVDSRRQVHVFRHILRHNFVVGIYSVPE